VRIARMFTLILGSCSAALAAGSLTSCSGPAAAQDARLQVAAAFAPLAEIAQQVGGNAVHVDTIVPPGDDAHEYDPTPKQITGLANAEVVLYLGHGFQPNIEQAISTLPGSTPKIDLYTDISLIPAGEGIDPHAWLDPKNMATMADTTVAALSAARPADAATFRANADTYITELTTLDHEFATGLQSCTEHALVSSHRSWAYLAKAYGLAQASIAGISPGEEPSAKQLLAITHYVKANHIGTIFFDDNLPGDLATTVAHEADATTAVLDPIETISKEQLQRHDTYLSLMRRNLAALRKGLGCT
jgi:zinc transport system substrate-binding protein